MVIAITTATTQTSAVLISASNVITDNINTQHMIAHAAVAHTSTVAMTLTSSDNADTADSVNRRDKEAIDRVQQVSIIHSNNAGSA